MIRRVAAVLQAAVLAACVQGAANEPLPTRPPVPDGWRVVEEDHRQVRLALPPDVVAFVTDGLILANESATGGKSVWLEVSAMGPASVEPRLQPGQSLRSWLTEQFAHAPGLGPMSFVSADLPVGRGTMLSTPVASGTAEETLILWYVIATDQGIGYVRFLVPPGEEETRRGDIETIALLLEF